MFVTLPSRRVSTRVTAGRSVVEEPPLAPVVRGVTGNVTERAVSVVLYYCLQK